MKKTVKIALGVVLLGTLSQAKVYENGEDGKIDRWRALENGSIVNVEENGNRAIQLNGESRNELYILGGTNKISDKLYKWDAREGSRLSWRMNFEKKPEIYVVIRTAHQSHTIRYIKYVSSSDSDESGWNRSGSILTIKVPKKFEGEEWVSISRDVEDDLQAYVHPNDPTQNRLVAINGFMVAGLGLVDDIEITDNEGNAEPIANAGSDQTLTIGNEGVLVQLDGSGSSDPDNDLITYSWSVSSQPEGSNIVLNNTDLVNPIFTADFLGTYELQLVVNDGQENSQVDKVLVRVIPSTGNTPPTISLVGESNINIVKGLPFVDEGATANDTEDGNITADIITSGVVDTDIVGEYTLTYSITDDGGLQAQVSRTIRVLQGNIDGAFGDPDVNTEHNVHMVGIDTSSGTLKLVLDGGSGDTTFPYIWIANSGEGTISLLSTETGDELGRYRTGPTSGGNPSRTTVDRDGNVWVGNRNGNTITKIGLKAWDQCIDRNANGVIDTSTGGTDVKSWTGWFGDGQGIANAEDECVLQHVTLAKDGLSANRVRLVAIDANNNVFAGGSSSNALFQVNGETGVIINAVSTLQNHYGGVIDNNGNIWSMPSPHTGTVQKINHDMSLKENISIGHNGYGITIDKYGKVWTTEYGRRFSAFDPSDPVGTLKVFNQTDHSWAQGVAVDSNGDIFIAGSLSGSTVGQYRQTFDIDGNFTGVEFVKNHAVQNAPTGVAVDATGKVWASNQGSSSVSRIDPVTEVVDHFPVGSSPYNYSDMTGNVVRNITEKTGTWEATFDSNDDDYTWNEVKWRLKEVLPAETTIKVFAKTANNEINLAGKSYVEIQNEIAFNLTGRYLKIKIELVSQNLTDTPEVVEIELF